MGMSSILFKGLCVLGLLFGQQASAAYTSDSSCPGPCPPGDNQCLAACNETKAAPASSCPGPCPPGDTQCQAVCKETKPDNSAPTGSSCSQDLASLIAACDREVSSTESSCDEKNDSGMNSVSSQAAAITLAMGQQTASSIQAACSGVAALTQAANAALAAYRLNCSSSINSCKSSCSSAVSYYQSHNGCAVNGVAEADYSVLYHAQSQVDRCNNFTVNIQQAQQAIANYGQTSSNASQCAALTSADNSNSDLCATNPKLPGCTNKVADCNDPSMASNKVCICTKNPGDPQCVGTSAVTGDNKMNSMDMSSRLASPNAASNGEYDTPGLPSITPGQVDNSPGKAIDGKQGAGVAFGSSSGGGAGGSGSGSRGSAAAGAHDPHGGAVNAGFYGGGGSSGGGSGYSGSGSGSGGGGVGGLWNRFTKAVGVNKPDLRQFLPGGRLDPNRGIAGASGPDGITGPHSNIWQKVQNRYKLVSPTLIP